ncbi:hypothetical protein DFP72DRAFT_881700 [Ephemerocybe angulata]|uniref:Uncharacterized protein n=1 Tax=Ephemerocybe angulata TaxID=980116 RepID=A0A8H6I8J5_9AGAR|nr:hypothetical protein DFP72DRAFT_881700 [Tulosesus angulatus]
MEKFQPQEAETAQPDQADLNWEIYSHTLKGDPATLCRQGAIHINTARPFFFTTAPPLPASRTPAMTEYDYSPEAYKRHLEKQEQVAEWVSVSSRSIRERPTGNAPTTMHYPASHASQGGVERNSESRSRRDAKKAKEKAYVPPTLPSRGASQHQVVAGTAPSSKSVSVKGRSPYGVSNGKYASSSTPALNAFAYTSPELPVVSGSGSIAACLTSDGHLLIPKGFKSVTVDNADGQTTTLLSHEEGMARMAQMQASNVNGSVARHTSAHSSPPTSQHSQGSGQNWAERSVLVPNHNWQSHSNAQAAGSAPPTWLHATPGSHSTHQWPQGPAPIAQSHAPSFHGRPAFGTVHSRAVSGAVSGHRGPQEQFSSGYSGYAGHNVSATRTAEGDTISISDSQSGRTVINITIPQAPPAQPYYPGSHLSSPGSSIRGGGGYYYPDENASFRSAASSFSQGRMRPGPSPLQTPRVQAAGDDAVSMIGSWNGNPLDANGVPMVSVFSDTTAERDEPPKKKGLIKKLFTKNKGKEGKTGVKLTRSDSV